MSGWLEQQWGPVCVILGVTDWSLYDTGGGQGGWG